MRNLAPAITLVVTLAISQSARAEFNFDTRSTASQTIDSPLFGAPFTLTATGTQHFTIDPGTGFANVTSNFTGSNLPDPLNPGGFLSYSLYNTVTTGTVTDAWPVAPGEAWSSDYGTLGMPGLVLRLG